MPVEFRIKDGETQMRTTSSKPWETVFNFTMEIMREVADGTDGGGVMLKLTKPTLGIW